MRFPVTENLCFHAGLRDCRYEPSNQSVDEHSPHHTGVGAELVVSSTHKQPSTGHLDDVILGPMVLNIQSVLPMCSGMIRVVAMIESFSQKIVPF